MRLTAYAILIFSMNATAAAAPRLPEGIWRAVITLQGRDLPFNFTFERNAGKPSVTIHNGAERLRLDEVQLKGDSVVIVMGIFDSEIRARLRNGKLEGQWLKHHPSSSYALPFKAEPGVSYRFAPAATDSKHSIAGNWRVRFQDSKGNAYPAVGVFEQMDNLVTGTFLTSTGDYRFLEGQLEGDKVRLSTFDGSHAYVFEADFQPDGSLSGSFFSGKSNHETWTARPDPEAALPETAPKSLLKPGYEKMDFTFPDLNGKPVSLTDDVFAGKVVVVQLLGSWCPNCMDETAFLAPWYEANKSRGVEVIGLGYEYSAEFAKAAARLQKMQSRFGITYPLLVAGTSDKKAAAATLPMLHGIEAFPTTLFLDRQGRLRKIHSGFSGPGTGAYYEEFKQDFEQTIKGLLEE